MATTRLTRLMIEAMAKHLPPSASQLRLLDVNGEAGGILAEFRQDLQIVPVPGDASTWPNAGIRPESADAVVAFDYVLNERFLNTAMETLRPGGRLIVVNARGDVTEALGKNLEDKGYTRILVETAVECPLPTGVLMRGEKPHTRSSTMDRIQQVAQSDADMLDPAAYKGRYVHLLIMEQPNIPVWRRNPDHPVTWQAVALALANGDTPTLLAFSSLPKAVGFMQPAVLAGKITGVNKVGKFSRETAAAWTFPVLLNPDMGIFNTDASQVVLVDMDPASAEAPDE